MRMLALAAVFGVSLAAAGAASAEQWTDPNGRLTFDKPAGWIVEPQNVAGGGQTIVLAFNASSDCYLFSVENPESRSSSADAARNTTDQISASDWSTAANRIREWFPSGSAQVTSQSVDTSNFWPVQRAELSGGDRTVYGAVQVRPGYELRAFCSGGSAATFNSVFNSLGHPNDATWRTQAEARAAERAAAEAAAAAAAAAEAEATTE